MGKKRPPRSKAAPTSWPTRREAAADLTTILGKPITSATLDAWAGDPTCPLPHGRGAIDKSDLIEWARNRRGAGRPPTQGTNPESDVRAEILKRKLAVMDGVMIPVADVIAGISSAMSEQRRSFLEELPMDLALAVRGKTTEEAAELIRERLRTVLHAFSEAATPEQPEVHQ